MVQDWKLEWSLLLLTCNIKWFSNHPVLWNVLFSPNLVMVLLLYPNVRSSFCFYMTTQSHYVLSSISSSWLQYKPFSSTAKKDYFRTYLFFRNFFLFRDLKFTNKSMIKLNIFKGQSSLSKCYSFTLNFLKESYLVKTDNIILRMSVYLFQNYTCLDE